MSTATEMYKLIGKEGRLLTNEGLSVGVSIVDAQFAWGYLRVRVTPISGGGFAWVNRSRVTLGDGSLDAIVKA